MCPFKNTTKSQKVKLTGSKRKAPYFPTIHNCFGKGRRYFCQNQRINKKLKPQKAQITWEDTAQYLGAEADVSVRPVLVPALGVDADEPGHR